jgi:hypothetical protein
MTSPNMPLSLADVQEAVSSQYEVLGELGRTGQGHSIYLARERGPTSRLLLLELIAVGGDATGGLEYALEPRGEVQSPGSIPGRICPSCGGTDSRSGKFCARCRYNFSDGNGIQSREELAAQVREQTGHTYDLLGEIDHPRGEGFVYFARDRSSGGLVVLLLHYAGASESGQEFSLDPVHDLEPLLGAVAGERRPVAQTERTLFSRGAGRPPAHPREPIFDDETLSSGWQRDPPRPQPRRIHWAAVLMVFLFAAGAAVLGYAYWNPSRPSVAVSDSVSLDTTIGSRPEAMIPATLDSSPPKLEASAVLRVRFKGLPATAIAKLDTTLVDSVIAGVAPGKHTLSVAAPGYQQLTRPIELSRDTTIDLSSDFRPSKILTQPPTPAAVDPCGNPGEQYNQANECYDEPPRLVHGSTRVQLPADFDGIPRSSTLWVRVSTTGKTVEVQPGKKSVPSFEELAFRRAYALEWSPALKDSKPVSGWVEVEIKPVPP